MEKPPRPEYLPLSFDLAPNTPEGASTTFMISPHVPGQRLEICGIATYNAPGECEILRISSGRSEGALNIGAIDAVVYNPFYPDADAVQDDEAPRFCRAPWGLLTHNRLLEITFCGNKNLRGTLYCRRMLEGATLIEGSDRWNQDQEFMRFIERAFESDPPSAALELMYSGWLGRARTGI